MRYTIIHWVGCQAGQTRGTIEAENPHQALMLADAVPAAAREWPYVADDVGGGCLVNEAEDVSWEADPL